MSALGKMGKAFAFVVIGIVTIIVGAFMIRGTMHMWDKPKDDPKDK
ncbi:hypothetical protein [Candidatus Nitrosotenuis aquarius]|nr:hypothetical protein [Candidatus Nitrosotenuis aquarius]